MAGKKEDMSKLVERMASLARLRFDPEKLGDFAHKAEAVLSYIDQLSELDTSGIEPTSHAADFTTSLRKDTAVDSGIQDDILESAPAKDGTFVLVPRVLEGEGA